MSEIKNIRLQIGKFGEGINPREHLCRKCKRIDWCGLGLALSSDRLKSFTGWDTLNITQCDIFEEGDSV